MNHLTPRDNHQFDAFEPHPELDDADVDHLQDVDWTKDTDAFGIFAARGMAPPQVQKPENVRREAMEMSGQIHRDYALLRSIVERHESKMQKRWEKKSKAQRLAILLSAWPQAMPLTHRPDFAGFVKFSSRLYEPAIQKSLRGACMWPYINQEDLVKPKPLLLLLHSRARNHPSVFAAADGEAMHLGRTTMVLVPPFLNQYVILLNGMTRQEDYGKLVAWDEHEDAFDWMHTRKQFIPGEGLLILEAQSQLMSFLVACCRQILHDIPLDEIASDKYPVEPETTLKTSSEGTVDILPSLTAMAKETPYRVPQKLDLERMRSLLAARVASAQDHIWALREDPGYYHDHILQLKEHRQEMIKDVHGNMHPTLRPGKQDYFWARLIANMLVECIFQLDFFTGLHDQVIGLQAMQAKYEASGEIKPGLDLPEDYLTAILKFRHYLNQVVKGHLSQLKIVFAGSPPVRHMFVRQPPVDVSPKSRHMTIVDKASAASRKDKITYQLFWLLRVLWEDDKDLFFCSLPVVVDELERLLRAETKARELVSPYIARLIGDLSIVVECLRQVETYQPWASGFDNAMVDRQKGIEADFAKLTQAQARMYASLSDEHLIRLRIQALGDPMRFKDYPVSKRRNKVVVESLRNAEQNLDAFWARIDNLLLTTVGAELNGTAMRRFLSGTRPLQRTPEWVEPVEPKQKSGKTAATTVEAITKPLSSVFLGSENVYARKEILASVAKTKVKSRGAPGSQTSDSEAQDSAAPVPPSQAADEQPTFAVDARALKVFRVLFFDAGANTTPGEVVWNDFLHAMSTVGFGAQKLYGSVWHFQPTKLDVERSIQFHEPHPQGKIPFLNARRIGRRLNRAYGWFGGMFLLKTK